ncbi:putative phospholipid-binding lipoprotein MlaA precursor [bacterium BMS3Bbin09]|nr:putative phospholipid-binding lipoprotein MlaA precursor [bacterium BMS3Bbin09]
MKIISIILISILFLLPDLSIAKDLQPDKAVEDGISDEYAAEDDEFYNFEEYEVEKNFREINDPIEPWNRLVFKFNDTFYTYAFKPAAKTYNAVVPEKARISVRNFFYNLAMPVRFVNDILQFRIKDAGIELTRFGVNSTLGIVGLFDVAEKKLDLKKHDEDLGQTLGSLGLGNGFYIVWPFLGPSSLRDTTGLVGDTFLAPINNISDDESVYTLNAYKYLNNGALRMEDYDDLKESAIDPYTAFKDAYFQYRQEQIKK